MIESESWALDWRHYQIPWDLQPGPPWDAVPTPVPPSSPCYPPGYIPPPVYPPNYSSITYYSVTMYPNAPVPIQPTDPFHGWTAQDKDAMGNWVMRPQVPGLTSP